jgi:hypothetical protein
MLFDRGRADADRQRHPILRLAVPLALTAAGVWAAWRYNQARHASVDPRNPYGGAQGLPEQLPHTDADEDLVEAAAEDSFPASDPPAYIAGDRMGRPPRR